MPRGNAASKKSTIVRAKQVVGLTAVRTAFRVAERTSPALGARWAETLWFTLPANGHRRNGAQPPGEPFEAPMPGGGRVLGAAWGQGPVVYLLHGWGGHRGQLGALVRPLVAAGHRVVAVDAPSHGQSPPGPSGPRRSTLWEFTDALRAAVEVAGPPHAVVAHSGGCMSVALAMRDGLQVPRVVFVAPVATFESLVPVWGRQLGMGERTLAGMVRRIERRVGAPFSSFDIPAMAPRLAGTPLLLVHDRDDPEVAWSHSQAIAAAWPGARLVTTAGLGHRRVLRDPGVATEVAAFVGEAASTPRPGGIRPGQAV